MTREVQWADRRLRKWGQQVGVTRGSSGRRQAGKALTHQNHFGAVGAKDFVGEGLARLRGAVPLTVQLQTHGVVPHGAQQLGHFARLQVVKVDGGTHNLVP